ncbi:methionyl-tRNA formyltransferase [Rickettsiella endosymbiont of Dermanyssus gallinae]|uniref:methionyl-tRNA formyltransferase n=1 Tax=Rickettsiella endosymbiont of Dermanyssus gallinae TaxID=2856608 RepID=UPI001C52BBDC|nr:methionyl-tRNA formyltransferase [Rickettsiella endosymbiont of Dermanyssus gallinae]
MNIILAGTPEFALPSLQALLASEHQVVAVYTQPDRPKGRGRHLLMSPIKQLALEKNLPVCQPITLRNVDEQKKLAAWNADLMVVVAYGLILPPAVLAIPPLGCINVHASLLPRWRGAAPIQRAILAGDEETGISIMQMDEGLDTGQVLQEVSCKIEQTDTSQTLQDRLAKLGAQALVTSLNNVEQGNYQLKPQSDQGSTYAKKIDKAEAEIDWSQNADVIARMIRAFNPKPVAYTFLGALLLRVWSAEVLDQSSNNPPGTILHVGEQGIDVMTGRGSLRLLQLQLPGGRCLPASALLHSKSHLFNVGTLLGQHD